MRSFAEIGVIGTTPLGADEADDEDETCEETEGFEEADADVGVEEVT